CDTRKEALVNLKYDKSHYNIHICVRTAEREAAMYSGEKKYVNPLAFLEYLHELAIKCVPILM
ncbi:MAG: hypothetical protein ACRDAX_00205, partial [Propionibacteriaceae bacterium]